MATGTYDPDVDELDLENEGWTREPDEGAHFQYRRPRSGPYGPRPLDEEYDEDPGDNREARRARGERGGMAGRVLAGFVILGIGATAVTWVFAGPLVAAAVGGGGVVVWAGRRLAAWGRAAGERRDRRDRRRGDRLRRQSGRAARGDGMLRRLMGGGKKKDPLAGRTSLLKGLGRGGGGRGGSGGGRGGGRGPKLGPSGPRSGGGRKPGAGLAGALGRLKPKGKGVGGPSAAKSAGMPGAKGKGPGRGGRAGMKGPRSLARLLPGAHGRAARAAAAQGKASKARAKAAKGNLRRNAATGSAPYVPGRMKAMLPGGTGRAARKARAAARASKLGRASSFVPGRLSAMMPGRRGRAARAARAHAVAKGKTLPKAMRVRRLAKLATLVPALFLGKYLMWVPARFLGKYAVARPGMFALKYGVSVPAEYAVWRPTKWLARRLVVAPSVAVARFATDRVWRRPYRAVHAYVDRKIRRHRLLARGRRIYWGGGRRFAFHTGLLAAAGCFTSVARGASLLAGRMAPQWMRKLRQLAASRGRWIAMLAALAMMVAGVVFGLRKAREWAWDGKPARHPFAPQPVAPAPDPVPAPAAAEVPVPLRPDAEPAVTGPAAGYTTAPPTGPQLARQSTTVGGENTVGLRTTTRPAGTHHASSDRLQIPGGLHPAHQSLLEDARYLHGEFVPRSFPDITIYLASMPDALQQEQQYWKALGDYLYGEFPGFNLVQSFAHRMEVGYSQLSARAHDIFKGYKDLHSADFARFLEPRVNELYADVRRWGATPGAVPNLSGGGQMHGRHNLFLQSANLNIAGFRPEDTSGDDRWAELRWWLQGLPSAFLTRAQFGLYAVDHGLVGQFPIEDGVADVLRQMARGWCALSDYGQEMWTAFEDRNPHDRARRDAPKPNEHLRDVGNTEMSNAGG